MKTASIYQASTLVASLLLAPVALAQTPQNQPDDPNTIGHGQQSQNLPIPTSGHDPAPPVAAPGAPEGGMVSQAGVGGNVAYGRAGVVELGGSAAVRSDPGVFSIIVAPSVGWFFQDNLELSGILDFNFQNLTGSASNTTARLLVEPSYHLPFNQTTFGFIGIGVGLGFNSSVGATSPVGFALAPRLGMNFLVGRSGVFTPALFVNYSTVSLATTGNTATLAVTPSYGLQLGYTVML